MPHPTHLLKSYTGDPGKRMIFCTKCGKEEDEGLGEPCPGQFYAPGKVKDVDKDKEPK